ncbi:hypothetical protein ACIPT4_10035, partial [Pectobacterium jejuense]|uniref:hypothetical protein n=1 Tax=Pectobacterium jejuense TaxID=2974022 RepID=UPI003812C2AA
KSMTRITLQQLDAQDGSCKLGLRHPWRKRFTLLFRYSRFRSVNRFVITLQLACWFLSRCQYHFLSTL